MSHLEHDVGGLAHRFEEVVQGPDHAARVARGAHHGVRLAAAYQRERNSDFIKNFRRTRVLLHQSIY